MAKGEEALLRGRGRVPGYHGGVMHREGVVGVVPLVVGCDAQQGQGRHSGEKVAVGSVALGRIVQFRCVCAPL